MTTFDDRETTVSRSRSRRISTARNPRVHLSIGARVTIISHRIITREEIMMKNMMSVMTGKIIVKKYEEGVEEVEEDENKSDSWCRTVVP
jgi:hypothetical protein